MLSIVFFFIAQIGSYALALVNAPAFAFVGYEIVYFLYDRTRWWYWQVPDIPYSFLISCFVLALALADRKRTSEFSPFSSWCVRWMWLLVLLHGAAYFWSLLPEYHLETFDNFVKLALIATAACKLCAQRRDLENYLYAYIFGGAYLGYYLLEIGRNAGDRVGGLGTVDAPDINAVAAMLAPAAIFALHMFWAKSGWLRGLMVVAGALIVNALVLMNSRGAFLGLFCGAAWYMGRVFLLGGNLKFSRLQVIGIVFLGLVALLKVFDQTAIDRFFGLREEVELSETRETGSTRIFFWLAAVEMSRDYPFGKGSGAFVALSPQYIPETVNTGRSRNRAVHSSWFQTLTEVGYPGLFFFGMMLLSSWLTAGAVVRHALATRNREAVLLGLALQAGLLAYVVAASFLDRMRAEAMLWLVVFTACGYNVLVRHQAARAANPKTGAVAGRGVGESAGVR